MDLQAAAAEAAGNHLKFESFGWHDRPEDDEKWTIVYTSTRDSGTLAKANEKAIIEMMLPFTEGDSPDASLVRHSHWAVGFVDGYEIRVYDAAGTVTDAFKQWVEIKESLEGYGCLDETIYSEMQDDVRWQSWEFWGSRDFKKTLGSFQPSIAKMLERCSDEVLWDLWYAIARETAFVEAFIEESDGIYFPLDQGCLTTKMKGKAIREELTRLRRQEAARNEEKAKAT
jgi:hypothetical protein